MMIVPHRVTSDLAEIWIGAFERKKPSGAFYLHLQTNNTGPVQHKLSSDWQSAGGDDKGNAYYQWLTVDVSENQPYTLSVRRHRSGRALATAELESLPVHVPAAYSGDNPRKRAFCVLLGSCYHGRQDRGRMAQAFLKLYEHPKYRPHVKLLVGDQVYIDQKGSLFVPGPAPARRLRAHFTSEYRKTWKTKLAPMLKFGGNIFIADDHEFWNNFPTATALSALPSAVRKSWRKEALALFTGLQGGKATTEFSLGDELSFFSADTRINRTSRPVRFMRGSDMEKLRKWVVALRGPGVLAIGQPVFATKQGTLRGRFFDYTLPNFKQYEELVRVIRRAQHDIVLVTGDVHFGRISSSRLRPAPGSPRLIEIVSSPMSLVSSFGHAARGLWRLRKDKDPPVFPSERISGTKQYPIDYLKAVRESSEGKGRTAEHFMTLSFSRETKKQGIKMDVRAWLIREPSSRIKLPRRSWTWTAVLR